MKILIADDNHIFANVLAEHLRVRGHEAVAIYNGQVASACFHRQDFDVIIIDLLMPDILGIEVLEQLYADGRMLRTILISGFPELLDEISPRLTRIGVEAVIQKPFLFTELDEALTRLGPSSPAKQTGAQACGKDIGLTSATIECSGISHER